MTMFEQLRKMTEYHLQRSQNSTGISMPQFFTRRHVELVLEAADRTGLGAVFPELWLDNSAATAAIAANGIGMRKHYRSLSWCCDERGRMSSEVVLVVEYSQAALGVAVVTLDQGFYERERTHFIDLPRHGSCFVVALE